jgi:hypothetical protein
LLKSIRPLQQVAEIILHHKEYLNGEGYPKGKQEASIPKSAQILTVANDYIELITGRLLETPLSQQEAMDYLESKDGIYYAKSAVDALKASLSMHKIEQPLYDHGVTPDQLAAGMVLSRDLLNQNGDFLLAKGIELADSAILLLIELERSAKKHSHSMSISQRGWKYLKSSNKAFNTKSLLRFIHKPVVSFKRRCGTLLGYNRLLGELSCLSQITIC